MTRQVKPVGLVSLAKNLAKNPVKNLIDRQVKIDRVKGGKADRRDSMANRKSATTIVMVVAVAVAATKGAMRVATRVGAIAPRMRRVSAGMIGPAGMTGSVGAMVAVVAMGDAPLMVIAAQTLAAPMGIAQGCHKR